MSTSRVSLGVQELADDESCRRMIPLSNHSVVVVVVVVVNSCRRCTQTTTATCPVSDTTCSDNGAAVCLLRLAH